ncbi:ferrous iron transport protein B [Chloroflexus sp.]|uniref:ferrous iron transport protein B n=1 Tax=Chloroflexus sp. TaxID=1904827 RepID=UPI00298EF766|nr:ferrous iron transport protein B [Chloroflexus sp.]MDW8405980.1 ferrous iron transport protein B [Chloroflexus sp.]
MTTVTAPVSPIPFRYPSPIELELEQLAILFAQTPALAVYPARWLAIQALEGDETMLAEIESRGGSAVTAALNASLERLRASYGDELDIVIVDHRYRFVHDVATRAMIRPATPPATLSDRIDRIVTHRWFGIPIFLAVMWVVFKLTTDVAAPLVDWLDSVLSGPISRWVVALLGMVGAGGGWFESLLIDGVIAGVGGVLAFVPVLLSLYFALALLEDSGYMARAAFVMDRVMRLFGLHGKSFLPMIVGFGCSVPAIYATRTLDSPRDRILTGLLVPFMSCSARLPVYVLMAMIFFPAQAGQVIFGLYLTGIVVAVGVGALLRRTLFLRQPATPFVLELPPYRLPTLRNIWRQMWERTSAFVRKAGTVILATSIVVWLLLAIPVRGDGQFADTPVEQSAFAALAHAATPVFAPLGFGNWESSGALVTGLIAKEVVVGTLTQVYVGNDETATAGDPVSLSADVIEIVSGLGAAISDVLRTLPGIVGINLNATPAEPVNTGLATAIQASLATSSNGHGALAALAFLVFVLLYTPCVATLAASRHEFGLRWMLVSLLGQFAIAWLAALIVFQGGLMLGV